MKIVLDGRPTQPGFRAHLGRGIGYYAQKLIKYLLDSDSVDTFSILWDGNRGFHVPSGRGKIKSLAYRGGGFLPPRYEILRNQMYLPRALSSAQADLVHLFCHEDSSLVVRGKLVLTIHDTIPLALPELYRPYRNFIYRLKYDLVRRLIKRADRIIVVSESTKRDVSRFYSIPGEKIEVVYSGVDGIFRPVDDPSLLESVKRKYQIKGDFIFYAGGIDPRKNVKSLLKTFHRLQRSGFTHLSLVIGGEITNQREYPALIDQIKRLNLDQKVRLVGYIPEEDLVFMYNAAHLFLFPSLYEGFGLPLVEAMACGTPVITSNVSSMPEITADAAILVDPLNLDQIVASAQRVLSDPNLAISLREKGLKRARFFNWGKTAKVTLEVYRRVVNS